MFTHYLKAHSQFSMKTLKLLCTLSLGLLFGSSAMAQFGFIFEPMSQSASVGADVIFLGTAFGPEPLEYQWRKNGVPLPGAVSDALYLPNVQVGDAGNYDVVVTGFSGSMTSEVAVLTIDAQFAKIQSDPLVNEGGISTGSAWGDYDGDGDLDVLVTHGGTALNSLFRNRGDGSFEAVNLPPITTDLGPSAGAMWVDYDNDNALDLFVINSANNTNCFLYHNNGAGNFTRVTVGLGADTGSILTAAWADYDSDGWLDLIAAPTGGGFMPAGGLYHNQGGILSRVELTLAGVNTAQSAAWTDFDSDGDLDMFFATAAGGGFFGGNGNEAMYINRGQGAFTRMTNGVIVTSGNSSPTTAWADYDGDGDLDVYVGNINGQVKFLFRNNGDGTFTQVFGVVAEEEGDNESAAWGDYDNDGWIDLFVANNTGFGNFLFHNDGGGVFTKVELGSVTGDRASSISGAWADIDNDGDLDLFVTNLGENNFLYRNNGNSNAWLQVKLVGFSSNRSAVGAKVRVQAMINGESRWQMREIAVRDSSGSPNSLRAEFGLGDAAIVETLRIEWPSGLVQDIPDVAPRQVLTLMEPPSIQILGAQAWEGDTGVENIMTFPVRLTAASSSLVSVDYHTVDGTALAGTHYLATNGTVYFQPGQTNQTIQVLLIGNLDDDTNRTFFVQLTNPVKMGTTITNAVGRIQDDDPLNFTLQDASVVEGTGGYTYLNFVAALIKPWHEPVTFSFSTFGSTGVLPDQDYVPTNGTLTIPAGQISVTIPAVVVSDALNEIDETIFLNVSNVVGAVPLRLQASGIILNDDPLPVLSLFPSSVLEGDSGTNDMVVAVSLSAPSGRTVSFNYGTSNSTAAAFFDYRNASGLISMPTGMTQTNFVLRILGDTLPEGTEFFWVYPTTPVNLVFATNRYVATIFDNDFRVMLPSSGAPNGSISFVSVSNRVHRVERTFSLQPPNWQPVPGAESVLGNGSAITVTDSAGAAAPVRFYRVLLP